MPTERFRSSPSERELPDAAASPPDLSAHRSLIATTADRRDTARPVPAKQIHRWLDDGGAPASEPIELSPPVTWSPQALNARLVAEEALRALPRRPSAITAEARARISRIIAQVEQRQLTLRAATAQLRDLTIRLQQHRRAEEARRRQWRSGRLSHRHA